MDINGKYLPLSSARREIRLIRLLPGPYREYPHTVPIRCVLQIHTLDSADYDALSYEWSRNALSDDWIYLRMKKFAVRENLSLALQHIRHPTDVRTLWIDAICIDQNNVSERNEQVKMMGDIYRMARRVRVWLGGDNTIWNIPHASFPVAKEIWEVSGAEVFSGRVTPGTRRWSIPDLAKVCFSQDPRYNKALERLLDYSYSEYEKRDYNLSPNIYLLSEIFKLSYWKRVWIVQEYVLARETIVHCGAQALDGHIVETAVMLALHFSPREDLRDHFAKATGAKVSMQRSLVKNRSLLELLRACEGSFCSNPKDKIYALLGLATDVQPNSFIIDYDRSFVDLETDLVAFLCRPHLDSQHSLVKQLKVIAPVLGDVFHGRCVANFSRLQKSHARATKHEEEKLDERWYHRTVLGHAWRIPVDLTQRVIKSYSKVKEESTDNVANASLHQSILTSDHQAYFIRQWRGEKQSFWVHFVHTDNSQYLEFEIQTSPEEASITPIWKREELGRNSREPVPRTEVHEILIP